MKATMSRRAVLAALGAGAAAPFLGSRAASGRSRPGSAQASGGAAGASDVPLHYLSLRDAARRIEARELSSTELTETLLDRIAAIDGRLKSYATVMADQARAAAAAADREIGAGNYRGPLHGVPIAVKDLCYTRGVRTMGATPVLADFVPDYDATVVARLTGAGAVLLGKLNLTEGAMAAYHPDFSTSRSTPGTRDSGRASRRAAPASPPPPASASVRSAPTPADPSASRRRSAASWGSSRPGGSSAATASSSSPARSTMSVR